MEKISKTDAEWQRELSPEEYRVARQGGTEPAFLGRYWDNQDDGLYACVGCGTPLFSSRTKYDSGTGWPSFFAPENPEAIETEDNLSHDMHRKVVKCAVCGSHLGHVFDDGPRPTGLRYCLNSLSLRFIPEE